MIKNKILYNSFTDWKLNIVKSKGDYIWDDNGNKYIDFTSAWNVTNLGHNHPEITEAIIKQAKISCYVAGWNADPIQNKYADLLTQALPKELNVCVRATGGTEANEEAIKTARAFTGRQKIIGFKNTYHGQSYATISLGKSPESEVGKAIGPLLDKFVLIDFPSVKASETINQSSILKNFKKKLEIVLKNNDVAAIVCEVGIITGWGSTLIAPEGFLTLVRNLTKKYQTLLILDEVGTGFSRCGKLFGMELEKIVPDIVTFAKGISNGAAAIGAMVTTEEIGEKTYATSNIYSTFGWNPVACAASIKTLEIHKRNRVWEKAKKDGEYILSALKKDLKNNPIIDDINGIGMEIGVRLKNDAKLKMNELIEKARRKGLHLCYADNFNFQLMPSLTIKRDILNKGLEIFIEIVNSIAKKI